MSRKSMKPAHNRHINHGKRCPICNPPKGEWTERWKQKQASTPQPLNPNHKDQE